jgi:hypothetical protein
MNLMLRSHAALEHECALSRIGGYIYSVDGDVQAFRIALHGPVPTDIRSRLGLNASILLTRMQCVFQRERFLKYDSLVCKQEEDAEQAFRRVVSRTMVEEFKPIPKGSGKNIAIGSDVERTRNIAPLLGRPITGKWTEQALGVVCNGVNESLVVQEPRIEANATRHAM